MIDADHLDRVSTLIDAKTVESGSNLSILSAPDSSYFAGAKIEDRAGLCTHPLQTYLDTWHEKGRGEEAAQAILERRLRPLWSKGSL